MFFFIVLNQFFKGGLWHWTKLKLEKCNYKASLRQEQNVMFSVLLIITRKSLCVFNGQDFGFWPCPISPQHSRAKPTTTTEVLVSGEALHSWLLTINKYIIMRMHSSSLLSVFFTGMCSHFELFFAANFSTAPLSEANNNNNNNFHYYYYYYPPSFKTNMHSHHLFSTGKLWSALSLGKLSFSPTYLGQRPTTTTGQSAGHFCFVVCFQLAFWAFLVDFSTRY